MVSCLQRSPDVERNGAHRMEAMRPPYRALVLSALVFGTSSLACSSGPLRSAGGSPTDGGGAGVPATGAGGAGGSPIGGPHDDCPALGCAPSCPFGIKKDVSGCYTCTCNPAPTCTEICDTFCQYGNVIAGNGCPLCACNPPPATPCEAQCGPPPAVPHGLCEDMVHTAGSSCVMDRKTGVCAWQVQVCPPTCLPNVQCIGPDYWDTTLCKCVPTYCPCSSAQLCFKAVGDPGVVDGLPPQCGTPLPNCSAADKCSCLSPVFGKCSGVTDQVLACVCYEFELQ
jgi:hypothetical protein